MVSVNLNNRSWRHIFWLFGACLTVFGLPFILLNIIKVSVDLFYSVFLVCGILFLWVYVKRTSLQLRQALKSGWALGIILAVFIGLGLLSYTISFKADLFQSGFNSNVLIILWRGVVFGIIGTAMISTLPFIAVWRAFAGVNPGNFRKIWVSFMAIIAISLTSLSYSVGIYGFNKGRVIYNAKMNILTGIPTLLSGNPLASPITGAFLYSAESLLFHNQPDTTAGIRLAAENPGGSD
jgi:hypothetical protein